MNLLPPHLHPLPLQGGEEGNRDTLLSPPSPRRRGEGWGEGYKNALMSLLGLVSASEKEG